MHVTVKSLFWLLEKFKDSPTPTAQKFVLIGTDADVYALTRVLEDAMLIESTPDTTSRFSEDHFGEPPWDSLISAADRRQFAAEGRVHLLLDNAKGSLHWGWHPNTTRPGTSIKPSPYQRNPGDERKVW